MNELGIASGVIWLTLSVITVMMFSVVFFNALSIFMGVKMVGEDISYGKSMIVAGISCILTSIVQSALVIFLKPDISPWISVTSLFVVSVIILGWIIYATDELGFGLSFVAAALSNVFQIGMAILLVIGVSMFTTTNYAKEFYSAFNKSRITAQRNVRSQENPKPKRQIFSSTNAPTAKSEAMRRIEEYRFKMKMKKAQ